MSEREEASTLLRQRATVLRDVVDPPPENIAAARELEAVALTIERGDIADFEQVATLIHEENLLRIERAEMRELLRWAQHHVRRNVPQCNEFLGRAYELLGHDYAHSGNFHLAPKGTS